jgi:MFS family permease
MIEAYAFLAVFTVQVLAMSVLYPARFSRYVRQQAACLPVERLAQLFPDVDLDLARERFLARFRTVNAGIAILGLLLLVWLFSYMRPGWNETPVIALISTYFVLQILPLVFVAWLGFRFNITHRHSLVEAKRKATLQRRGLFDFISPAVVVLAILGYVLFVMFVLYVQPKPLPGFALIGVLTLSYAFVAFVTFRAIYGKSINPLETQAGRVHRIGLTVKVNVYSCIICAAFFAFAFTVDLLDLKRWVPLAQSACLLITSLFCLMSLSAPPSESDGLGPDGPLAPPTRNLSA